MDLPDGVDLDVLAVEVDQFYSDRVFIQLDLTNIQPVEPEPVKPVSKSGRKKK